MKLKLKAIDNMVLHTANKVVEEDIELVVDDTNIKPENIKKNISILGVIGTYDNSGGGSVDPISGMPVVEIVGGVSSVDIEPNTYYLFKQPVSTSLNLILMPSQNESDEYVIEICADEDDINVSFTSNPIQWNEAKNLYNIQEKSISLEGRYTHYLSIINDRGLAGGIVNPKLANTTITYNETTNTLSWTAVENAEWYEVYISDAELSNTFPTYSETFTSVPSGGITIPGFNPNTMMADGYVKACSLYYTDSKKTWSN